VACTTIPADDPGLLLGWTAFDTLRCYGRMPFRLGPHLARLAHSARLLRLPAPDLALLGAEVARVAGPDHRIRITLTAGGRRIVDGAPIPAGTVGRDVTVARFIGDPSRALPGTVKHGSRLAWTLAAMDLGVDEVLLVSLDGHVLEAANSAVLAVKDGAIWVPPLDGRQLASVTRDAMLDAARQAGINVRQAPLPATLGVDELYLISTLKELSPVVAVDGVPGPGTGPVGRRLYTAFRELVVQECAQGAAATE
jgi:branched-chain amino acid aminotransferase